MGGAREWVHLEVNAARAAAPDGPSVGPDLIINHLLVNTCKESSFGIRCIYFGIDCQCCCSRDVNHLDSSSHVGRLRPTSAAMHYAVLRIRLAQAIPA